MSERAFLDDELWSPGENSAHIFTFHPLSTRIHPLYIVLSRFLGPSLYLRVTLEASGAIQYYSCESDVAEAMSAVTEIGAVDHTAVPAEFPLVFPALSRQERRYNHRRAQDGTDTQERTGNIRVR
ncbi:hypothetical protein AZE42_11551 [Rhizopogon vesiculosus]|uniref:Uncharacterized protein n=1 Tax=Rhizopogon vesiculosus TaxID=180088 RepID=A0A1J8QU98_9AGAM|nr:hypothetical protein AZE42_11551 [Rhizopogon vesiculosus]